MTDDLNKKTKRLTVDEYGRICIKQLMAPDTVAYKATVDLHTFEIILEPMVEIPLRKYLDGKDS